MHLQRMVRIEDNKPFVGFIEQRKDGGVYFNYWDHDYDNGKFSDKGKWFVAYISQFKPDFI